ncbi:gamma-glutamyltransferase [Corynebacterium sp. A21]|uniref:gamma-glutamyltransferase n=1 Tax=Corynebacterium sp. A21 TaxID=3457318 RepID=UPI003FD672D7
MKVTHHTSRVAAALLAGTALTLTLSACTTESTDGGEETGTSTSSDNTEAVAMEPCESTARDDAAGDDADSGAATEGAAEGTHSGEDISVAPEIATGYRSGMSAVAAQDYAVSTANPLASAAACEVLRTGGTAADALVTAQFVLGLTEPQSSGIGGGGYILYYDAESGAITAIDGRETAPVAATENYLIEVSPEDPTPPVPDARRSGRSIGVPGIVAALGELHANHGQAEWAELLDSPQTLATEGFEISPRMSASIANSAEDLSSDPAAASYFLQEDGTAKTAGTLLQNPDYAETLRLIAAGGPDAFYTGEIAADVVERATREVEGFTPSLLSTADLAAYTPETREALCAPYRDKTVCGMPPSSSGGVTVLNALGILNNFDLAQYAPTEVGKDGGLPATEAIHLISEAERLAYADRDAYIGDPAFVEVPGGGVAELISEEYTRDRSTLIDPAQSMGEAAAGLSVMAESAPIAESGTSHISVIDSHGNAASLTTSVEAAFGSFHFTRGFILNNQLTDFAAEPVNEEGQPVANRVESAKRPRSSMSPTLVFDTAETGERGELSMVLGSPGGSLIIQFVIKTLINIIDWGMDPQQAVSAPNFGALNQPETGLGTEHPLIAEHEQALAESLGQLGHEINATEQSSGLSALMRGPDGNIIGGADPRREGVVLGG